MATEIINIDNEIESVNEAINYANTQIDLSSIEIKIFDQYKREEKTSLKNAIEKLVKWQGGGKGLNVLVCENLFSIIHQIKINMDSTRKIVMDKTIELVELVEKCNEANEQLREEIAELEKELEIKNNVIDKIKDDKNKSVLDSMQNQINTLTSIISGKQPAINPDKWFEEDAEEEKPDYSAFDVEEEKPKKLDKKIRIAEAHKQMIEIMKGEDMYPMHTHEFPDDVRAKYVELWGFLCPRHNLSPDDYPKMLDRLEEYAEMPDNYLDEVRE
jgi:hypothetical protein